MASEALAVGATILNEAVIVACLSSALGAPVVKQKLTATMANLQSVGSLVGQDVTARVHPVLLSEATRFLREN